MVGSEAELGGPSYMVNIDGLLALLQRRTVYSVASERFGFVSARIVGEWAKSYCFLAAAFHTTRTPLHHPSV